MDPHFLFLLSSARSGGNSEWLARRAAAGLPGQQRWIDLASTALPAFADTRPHPPQRPTGQLAVIAGAMKTADDIIFVAPIYWYGLPAPAKLLLDHWSGWLDAPGFGFGTWIKGKRLWLITARADAAPDVPAQTEASLRRSGEWLGMVWGGALHGVADGPGDMALDATAVARAEGFLSAPR